VYRYDIAVKVTNDGFVKVFRHIERFRYEEEVIGKIANGLDETDYHQHVD
jgi:hypothetical protein